MLEYLCPIALYDLQAEVLQCWAEGLLAVCRSLPDVQLTRDAEQQANNLAKTLFQQAVQSYQQVLLPCFAFGLTKYGNPCFLQRL